MNTITKKLNSIISNVKNGKNKFIIGEDINLDTLIYLLDYNYSFLLKYTFNDINELIYEVSTKCGDYNYIGFYIESCKDDIVLITYNNENDILNLQEENNNINIFDIILTNDNLIKLKTKLKKILN